MNSVSLSNSIAFKHSNKFLKHLHRHLVTHWDSQDRPARDVFHSPNRQDQSTCIVHYKMVVPHSQAATYFPCRKLGKWCSVFLLSSAFLLKIFLLNALYYSITTYFGSIMLQITRSLIIDPSELTFSYVRSPGPGGQNVNKLATAALLRFNIRTSTAFNDELRTRVLTALGNRLTKNGELIIKASRFRTQERNRQDALDRFISIIRHATLLQKPRKKTKPTKTSVQTRLNKKTIHGKRKALRGKVRGTE
jgi:ribosome-associated protein